MVEVFRRRVIEVPDELKRILRIAADDAVSTPRTAILAVLRSNLALSGRLAVAPRDEFSSGLPPFAPDRPLRLTTLVQ